MPPPIIRFPYAAPFECYLSLLANMSTCQHVPSRKRVSPCPLAHVSPLARYFAGEGKSPPLAIVTILKSPPEAETQRR